MSFFKAVIMIFVIFLIIGIVRTFVSSVRKLDIALDNKKFAFFDNKNDVRKNFHVTYNGVLFEGEKYIGALDDRFEVTSIFIFTDMVSGLKGFKKEDFMKIEAKVKEFYPHAKIDWKSPIKEFIAK